MKRTEFAIVQWRDSHGIGGGWVDRQDAAQRDTGMCWSSGWVIYEDDDQLTLAPHVAPQVDDVAGEIVIPAEVIVQRFEVTGLPEPTQ